MSDTQSNEPGDESNLVRSAEGFLEQYQLGLRETLADFQNPRQEWRRQFSELLGTFFDGHGHHLLYGSSLWGALEPGREYRLCY